MLIRSGEGGPFLDGGLRLSDGSLVFVGEAGIFFYLSDRDCMNRRYVSAGCSRNHFNNLLKVLEGRE